MKPAAPVTRSLHAVPSSALSLGEIAGQAVLPGGQPDRVLALAGQGREGRARRRPAEFLGGDREHFALDLGLLEDLAGELVPGALAGGRHVVDAVLDPLDQADDPVGEVPGVGRRADLVADDEDLVPGCRRGAASSRRSCGRRSRRAGRADDEVALVGGGGRLLAGQLGAAVGRERRRLVALHVGRALGAVEDVVGGDVDDAGADRCAAAAATLPAPVPLTAKAASSASSAPSTSVQAAQLMTTSGRSRSSLRSQRRRRR